MHSFTWVYFRSTFALLLDSDICVILAVWRIRVSLNWLDLSWWMWENWKVERCTQREGCGRYYACQRYSQSLPAWLFNDQTFCTRIPGIFILKMYSVCQTGMPGLVHTHNMHGNCILQALWGGKKVISVFPVHFLNLHKQWETLALRFGDSLCMPCMYFMTCLLLWIVILPHGKAWVTTTHWLEEMGSRVCLRAVSMVPSTEEELPKPMSVWHVL